MSTCGMIGAMGKLMSRAETYVRWWRRIITEHELLLSRVDQEIARGGAAEELATLQTSRASIIEKLEEARRELNRLLDRPAS